jgi:hypothetical protein
VLTGQTGDHHQDHGDFEFREKQVFKTPSAKTSRA